MPIDRPGLSKNSNSSKESMQRFATIFAIALLPLSTASASTQSENPDGNDVELLDQEQAIPGPDFALNFEPFDGEPPEIERASGAVDLSTFDPPLEAKPEESLTSLGTGIASYYGRRFHGRLTANGERFNMNAMTAAHKTLPFGTRVRVTNPRNGKSVTVRINDRGPFIRGRTIDLSRAAAQRIGMISTGHARVKLDILR